MYRIGVGYKWGPEGVDTQSNCFGHQVCAWDGPREMWICRLAELLPAGGHAIITGPMNTEAHLNCWG
jgi:hypothetical protein